jgi:ATP-binding cassette subfamily C protein
MLAVAGFSGVINLLMLTGSLFMLQVYDRVIPSRSVPTLVALLGIAAFLYACQGALELVRGRMLARVARVIDERLAGRGFAALVDLGRRRTGADPLRPLRDIDQVRAFLSGAGPSALFDLPWMPLYLGICFLFHPWIGMTALAGALILVALTVLTDRLSRAPVAAAARAGGIRQARAEASWRNAEVLTAMGMAGHVEARWRAAHGEHVDAQQKAVDVTGGLGTISRVARMMLQSAVLAVGAWLVIGEQATPGIMIASSLLTARALAPVELAIANWKGFVAARQSWRRLADELEVSASEPTVLPAPGRELDVQALAVAPPGNQHLVVQDVSFRLEAGQGIGIIGPSASGKSSLARALVGVWPPARGKVRLDRAPIDQWSSAALGRHVGYLPQDVELFAGTVAENIARFDAGAEATAIVDAAKAAGAHEMIVALPQGYDTQIGEGGAVLSGGQRQRIGLARALFGAPFLVVLDEPNANLDSEGEAALTQAMLGVRARGGIVVVVAHRPSALAGVDQVLALAGGRARALGPKEEVLRAVLQPAQPAVAAVRHAEPARAGA